jgi:hypothetical protein
MPIVNIYSCCSDLCFEIIQPIHSLIVHLVFYIVPYEVQRHKIKITMGATQLILLFLPIDVGNSSPNIYGKCEQNEKMNSPVEA